MINNAVVYIRADLTARNHIIKRQQATEVRESVDTTEPILGAIEYVIRVKYTYEFREKQNYFKHHYLALG